MPTATGLLNSDELARRLRACSARAAASGALVPLTTRVRRVDDGGLPFAVRICEPLQRKQAAAPADEGSDPFAPPREPDLHVGDISPTHTALLNKYNVLPEHLLLVTRAFEDQGAMLTRADFEAALLALAAVDGLVFYNGGREAGASQPHKHLQLVPLPLAPGPAPLPFSAALEASGLERGPGTSPALPFAHAMAAVPPAWWHAPRERASEALAAWQGLWHFLGADVTGLQRQPLPYNLLLTREWLWLVPRSRGEWQGIGVNALGFAGALLVGGEAAYDRLLRVGPANLLAATAAGMDHRGAGA